MNVNKLTEIIKENTTLEVSVQEIQKGNVTRIGISIGIGTVRPILYVKNYEELFETLGYEAVARQMLIDAENAIERQKEEFVNLNNYTSWEYAKENLKLCIAPKGTNEGIVTYPYLDLELYVRVIVTKDGNGQANYKVKLEVLDMWNITKEQLFQVALDCTKPTYKVQSMSELLFGFEMENDPCPMIVINTKDGLHGASVIYCKEILKEIADKYDSNLFIIPSSIHEIIVKPIDLLVGLDEMTEMVKDVNTSEVEPEEVLSNHAYIFRKDTMEITW